MASLGVTQIKKAAFGKPPALHLKSDRRSGLNRHIVVEVVMRTVQIFYAPAPARESAVRR
jgi:hypothetical protein